MSSIKIYTTTEEIKTADELLQNFGIETLNPEVIKDMNVVGLNSALEVIKNFLSKIASNKMEVSDKSPKQVFDALRTKIKVKNAVNTFARSSVGSSLDSRIHIA